MKRVIPYLLLIAVVLALFVPGWAEAHTVNYQVENKGLTVRVFYAQDDPASYCEYEVYGPGDEIPHQKGRTDKNGCVSFLPDRKGTWKVKVWGESEHGFHGTDVSVEVGEGLMLKGFKKPLVATHLKLFVGVSLIFGLFGIITLWRNWRGKKAS